MITKIKNKKELIKFINSNIGDDRLHLSVVFKYNTESNDGYLKEVFTKESLIKLWDYEDKVRGIYFLEIENLEKNNQS